PDLLGPLCWGRTLCLGVSSIRSGISVADGRPSGRNFGGHARHSMGACPLLCRRDDFELDILLHLTYRFLNPDYCVFDCCGMALSEANLKPLACVRPSARATSRYLVRHLVLLPELRPGHVGRPTVKMSLQTCSRQSGGDVVNLNVQTVAPSLLLPRVPLSQATTATSRIQVGPPTPTQTNRRGTEKQSCHARLAQP